MKLDNGCKCGANDFEFIVKLGSKNIYKCNHCGEELLLDNGTNDGNETELQYQRDRNKIVEDYQNKKEIDASLLISLQQKYPDYCQHDPIVAYFIIATKTKSFTFWNEEFESYLALTKKNPLFVRDERNTDVQTIEFFKAILDKLITKYNKQKDRSYKKKKFIIKLSITSFIILVLLILGLYVGIEFSKMNNYINSYDNLMKNGSEELEYNLIENNNKNEYEILGASKTANGELYIPLEHNGFKVTKIADKAFENADWLKAVRIPDSIEYIGQNAFHNTGIELVDNRLYVGELEKLSVLESDKAIWPFLRNVFYNDFLNRLEKFNSNLWLVEYNDNSKTTIIIKDETKGISRNVFSSSPAEEIIINNNLEFISYQNGDNLGNIKKVHLSYEEPKEKIKLINNLFKDKDNSTIYIDSVDLLNELTNDEDFLDYNLDLNDNSNKAYLYFYNDLGEKIVYESDLNNTLNNILDDILNNKKEEYKNIIASKDGYEIILFNDQNKNEKINKDSNVKPGKTYIYNSYNPIIYNIEYDLDGGLLTTDNQTTYTILDNIVLNNPAKVGYEFVGWDDSNIISNNYSIINSIGNKSLKAIFKANEYKITYSYGYDDKYIVKDISYDDKIVLNQEQRDGYTFLGWYIGDELITNETYKYLKDSIFTAKWEANKYNVILNGINKAVEVTFDEDYKFDVDSKEGYYFIGWYDSNNNKYTDDLGDGISKWKIASDIILNPKFDSQKIEAYLDVNGGNSLSSNKVLIGYEEKLNLPIPTRNGYIFKGWFDEDNGYKKINNGDIYNKLVNLNVIAKWDVDPISIGKYVNDKTTVSDTDGLYEYIVIKKIDSMPFAIENDYIFDFSEETNLDFSKSNRDLPSGEGRKGNLDLKYGTHNVYFVGDQNLEFLNFYIHTVNLVDSNYNLNINLVNFIVKTNGSAFLEQWRSDDKHSESGPTFIITTSGSCALETSKSGGSIFGTEDKPINNLIINGGGTFSIKGGNGTSSITAGNAINAKNIIIDRTINSSFIIQGGNGAKGANGTDTNDSNVDTRRGYNGQIGGIGINCEDITITNPFVSITGGNGGNGGQGGKSTAGILAWDPWKPGGNGGNGARGGIGIKCKTFKINDLTCVHAGSFGQGGKGGKGFNDDPYHYGSNGSDGPVGFVIYDYDDHIGFLATDKYELSQYAYAVKLNSDFDEPNHRGSYEVQKVSYSEAYNIARAQNAHLATVASKEENEVLKNMFKKFGYHGAWLGGTDKGHEGIWTWVTGESFGFNEWASGEPNNDGAEDYLGFTDSGYKWNDFKDESDVRSFFIEF